MQWLTQPCLSPDTDFIDAATPLTSRQALIPKMAPLCASRAEGVK